MHARVEMRGESFQEESSPSLPKERIENSDLVAGFKIELDGVAASSVVSKGISINPFSLGVSVNKDSDTSWLTYGWEHTHALMIDHRSKITKEIHVVSALEDTLIKWWKIQRLPYSLLVLISLAFMVLGLT
ncbi:hypothetical protein VNO77_15795 [Canavalia gladiata]|uniref:Uncharacterized protein n=1 Tax=Canavalia gladiata TaxID=3824 RepID=A0AAN9QRE4_CANGL